jgi:hypothetical protein
MKFCIASIVIALTFADNRHNLRRNLECPDGFGGSNCNDGVDECQATPYPCTGGNKEGSFCVDHDPPQKFKCGCLPGYEAVLPNASDIQDNVTLEWRPLKCLPRDVCVGFVCHEDATCTVSSNKTAVCICNDALVGDGITNCAPVPKTAAAKKPSPRPCNADSDCDKLENSVCVDGFCICKAGFYLSNGKGQCVNENECAHGFANDCHRNAICEDTEGSYICTCKDGHHDLNPNDKPGTICAQTNECANSSMNDCNIESQVCIDLPPPLKWQCVERTPAPTPSPTTVCIDDKAGGDVDSGCSNLKPLCVSDGGKAGWVCAFCINDNLLDTGGDLGCLNEGDCLKSDFSDPPLNGVGSQCLSDD